MHGRIASRRQKLHLCHIGTASFCPPPDAASLASQGMQQNGGMQPQGHGQGFNGGGLNGGGLNGGFERREWRDMTSHPKYKTKPCRYFAAGSCKNGDRCTFLHDPNFVGDPSDQFNSYREYNGQNRFGFCPR